MIQRVITTTLGSISTGMGLLIVLPKLSDKLWIPQLLLNEFPWVPALLGTTATVWGAFQRPRGKTALVLGAVGTGLSLKPLWWVARTIANQNAAMRAGLGEHYEESIPAEAEERMASSRWSLRRTVGWRNLRARSAVKMICDVPYLRRKERELKLDVYQPKVAPAVGERYPAIIVLHGGSWGRGDKQDVFVAHHRYLASQGYVVFAIQYRLSVESIWPAQLQDVHCAIRWVKAHAAEYQIDPERIALLGRSAGGHLALMAAYRAADSTEAQCDENGAGASVRAVVAIYPPTDLRLWPSLPESAVTLFMGGLSREVPERYVEASPVEHVRNGLPPTLMVQGYMDDLVFPAHSESLYNRLSSTDTPAVLLRVPWGRHGFDALMAGLGAQLTQYQMDRFLAWSLYKDTPS